MNKTLARMIAGVIPNRELRKRVRNRLMAKHTFHIKKMYSTPRDEMPYIAWKSELPPAEPVGLARFGKNVFSQNGEDGILEHIFSILGTKTKYGIEFGAWDGKHLSNTFNFVMHHGWRALMIEGNPEKFKDLQKTSDEMNGRIDAVCGRVGIKKYPLLDTFLKDCPEEPDLLSIDVDGIDYYIWESLQTIRPRVVIIEFNPAIPSDIIFIQAKNENVSEGSSAAALVELGTKKGYSLASVIGCNLIFVNNAEFAKLEVKDNSLETLWSESPRTRIFHVYTGKIYTWGMPALYWSNAEIRPDMLQFYEASAWKSENTFLNFLQK